jgi:hypothetical protein
MVSMSNHRLRVVSEVEPPEAGLDKGIFSNNSKCKILKNKGQKRQ